jgi:hypothetical protein
VRAGVVQVLALQVNLCATKLTAGACSVVDGARATYEVGQFVIELTQKLWVVLVACVIVFQFGNGVCEGFTHKAAAIRAKMAARIGLLVVVHGYASIGKTY